MVKKWLKKLNQLLASDADFEFVKDDICESNRRMVQLFCPVSIAIMSILFIVEVFIKINSPVKHAPVFLAAIAYAAGVLLLVRRTSAQDDLATMTATYLTMAAMYLYGIFISYRSPEQYTVTFIALMSIVSMTFVDKLWRMGLATAIGTAVCVSMVWFHKDELIRNVDIINIVSFSILSFVASAFSVQMKVRGYVMTKLYERDIEKGQQRLKVVEVEALQLLTAVKETYDMVVSVNLTKNTYKFIGTESFVTQGDDAEGVFDEVIETHAGKVVEAHRALYLDTFSRQALLKAYAEGKKGVYLEYQQCDENGIPHWLGTYTMFTDSPYSSDVTEITISRNLDETLQKEAENKAALQEALLAANRASKAKSEFLSRMSHDIRTPLNAIFGMITLAGERIEDADYVKTCLEKVKLSSQHLLSLINDILDMSKVESGQMMLISENFSLRACADELAGIFGPQAEEKHQSFLLCTEGLLVKDVCADRLRISQVMMNLLSNAVKYTPEGGTVHVEMKTEETEQPDHVRFTYIVSDSGIGMSEEFQQIMYSSFERENNAPQRTIQGSGLGLAICKEMVDLMGGSIDCSSVVGEGTTFTVVLTLKKAAVSAEESVQVTTAAGKDSFAGVKILIAEDNDFNWEIAKELLAMHGVETVRAENGQECVSCMYAAADGEYDMILMDIQMPVMNGYEATQAIRASQRSYLRTIPIIAMTADAFVEDIRYCMEMGMDGHLAKPIELNKLLEVIRNRS